MRSSSLRSISIFVCAVALVSCGSPGSQVPRPQSPSGDTGPGLGWCDGCAQATASETETTVPIDVLERAFQPGSANGARLPPLTIQLAVPTDTVVIASGPTKVLTPIDLAPISILPIVRAEASEAYRDGLDAVVDLQKAMAQCAGEKSPSCGDSARTNLHAKELALLRALESSQTAPLAPGDRLLRVWLEARRAERAHSSEDEGPKNDSPLAVLARETRPHTAVGFAARYFYAAQATDPQVRTKLYDEMLASPVPGGFSRAELLFRRAEIEVDEALATPRFRVAAEVARKTAREGGPNDRFVELAVGLTWAARAMGSNVDATFEGVSVAIQALAEIAANREHEVDVRIELASALAWAFTHGRPKVAFSVPKSVFVASATSLAEWAHQTGDLELERRLRLLAAAGPDAKLTAMRWNEAGIRAAVLRLHAACTGKGAPPPRLSQTTSATIHLVHNARTTTATIRELPSRYSGYSECVAQRGPRILWNAPDVEVDLTYRQP